jgi:hypothetical protein
VLAKLPRLAPVAALRLCSLWYLWSVYERARKVDTIKVQERIKATVKKNGKGRTVTKTITKLVEFGAFDPHPVQNDSKLSSDGNLGFA